MRAVTVIILIVLSAPLPGEIKKFPVVTPERLALTREYCLRHYGMDTCELSHPKIIVIHYTAIGSLRGSLECFRPAGVSRNRTYIRKFGRLNVGVHFVVAQNGDIYSLLPTSIIGRHAIGFNHCSIGIENVARDSSELTREQLRSNAALVKYLIQKHPSIEFLIGHHEYTDRKLPHYRLYLQKDREYRPTAKLDPGDRFMSDLRRLLDEKYHIVLER